MSWTDRRDSVTVNSEPVLLPSGNRYVRKPLFPEPTLSLFLGVPIVVLWGKRIKQVERDFSDTPTPELHDAQCVQQSCGQLVNRRYHTARDHQRF